MTRPYVEQYFWNPLENDFSQENGWLINILPTSIRPEGSDVDQNAVVLFFLRSDGTSFRLQKIFHPYFYVMMPFEQISEFEDNKKVLEIQYIDKLDIGSEQERRTAAKLIFANVQDLLVVRREYSYGQGGCSKHKAMPSSMQPDFCDSAGFGTDVRQKGCKVGDLC